MKTVIAFFILSVLTPLLSAAEPSVFSKPEDAIKHLQKLWRDSLSAKLKGNPHHAHLEKEIFEAGRVDAQAFRSPQARERLMISLPSEARTLNIVWGNLDDLKIDRPLWAVANPGGMKTGFEAYLDAATGDLLLLGIPVEG
jgi:hypothetical protein